MWLRSSRADFDAAGPVYSVMVGVASAMGGTHSLLMALTLLAVMV